MTFSVEDEPCDRTGSRNNQKVRDSKTNRTAGLLVRMVMIGHGRKRALHDRFGKEAVSARQCVYGGGGKQGEAARRL